MQRRTFAANGDFLQISSLITPNLAYFCWCPFLPPSGQGSPDWSGKTPQWDRHLPPNGQPNTPKRSGSSA